MTTQTKHTPGPWTAPSAGVWAGGIKIASCGDSETCDTMRKQRRNDQQLMAEITANANLCAAAPEMYSKLEKIATWLEKNAERLETFADSCRDYVSLAESERANAKNYRATAADIRKLLAKAEGRQ